MKVLTVFCLALLVNASWAQRNSNRRKPKMPDHGEHLKKMKGCFYDVTEDPKTIENYLNCTSVFVNLTTAAKASSIPTLADMSTSIKDFMNCTMNRSQVLDANGNMNFTALRELANLTGFTGNTEKISAMRNVYSKCINESENMTGPALTGPGLQLSININKATASYSWRNSQIAAEEDVICSIKAAYCIYFANVDIKSLAVRLIWIEIQQCKAKNAAAYCSNTSQDMGGLDAFSALTTLTEDSPCKNVIVPSSVDQAFTECNNTLEELLPFPKAPPPFPVPGSRRGHKIDGKGSKNGIDGSSAMPKRDIMFNKMKEAANAVCAMRKLEFINGTLPEVTFNFTEFVNFTRNLTGWSDIPELRDRVFADLDNCTTNLTRANKPLHSMKDFVKCMMPKFADTCGLNNSVARFLFPFLRSDFASTLFYKLTKMILVRGNETHGEHFSPLSMQFNTTAINGTIFPPIRPGNQPNSFPGSAGGRRRNRPDSKTSPPDDASSLQFFNGFANLSSDIFFG